MISIIMYDVSITLRDKADPLDPKKDKTID